MLIMEEKMMFLLKKYVHRYNINAKCNYNPEIEYVKGVNAALYDVISDMCEHMDIDYDIEAVTGINRIYERIILKTEE